MTAEVALGHEVGEHRLLEQWRPPRCDRFHGGDAVDEIAGHDQVAESQRGEEHLAEAACVEHQTPLIERLKRRHRCAGIAILAVVVVFEDHCVRLVRVLEQRQPPRHAHGHAQRELVSGRYVNQPRRGPAQPGDDSAVIVHGKPRDRRAERCKRQRRADVARVFHANHITGIEEEARHQVKCFLHAGDDNHLFGGARHAARRRKVVGDLGPQRLVASRIRSAQQLDRRATQPSSCDLRPQPGGEQVQRWLIRAEGARARAGGRRKSLGAPGRCRQPSAGRRRHRRRAWRPDLKQPVWQRRADVAARPDARFHVAFRTQLLVSGDHTAACHAVVAGKNAAGRQSASGLEPPVEDRRAQAGAQPVEHRRAGPAWRQHDETVRGPGHKVVHSM